MKHQRVIIVGINGAPGSGKDTLAHAIRQQYGAADFKFADPIVAGLLSAMPHGVFNGETYRERFMDARVSTELKELPDYVFLGAPSVREMMIQYSEHFIKPVFGADYFGIKAASEVIRQYSQIKRDNRPLVITISDCGFQNEWDAFKDHLLANTRGWFINFHVVQVHRGGYTFDGDSRGLVFNDRDTGWPEYKSAIPFINNGSLIQLRAWVENELPKHVRGLT